MLPVRRGQLGLGEVLHFEQRAMHEAISAHGGAERNLLLSAVRFAACLEEQREGMASALPLHHDSSWERRDLALARQSSLTLQAKLLLTPGEVGFDPPAQVWFMG